MGFRMRKSIKVAPGVRLNVSKSGVGASVGGRGSRYSVHSSGRRTVSAGGGVIPGVYYQKTTGGSSKGGAQPAASSPVGRAKKPGLFAPKGEKELYKAVKAQDPKAMKLVGDEHPDFRLSSYSLAGLLMLASDSNQSEQPGRCIRHRQGSGCGQVCVDLPVHASRAACRSRGHG